MEWINVKDRLPEEMAYVIVHEPVPEEQLNEYLDEMNESGNKIDGDVLNSVAACFYSKIQGVFFMGDTNGICSFTPTHWMPMPKPPTD
tara:strand:+ start:737 stop:1000 length:264 start_codon:yes stop_codon:yes gene_type:complete